MKAKRAKEEMYKRPCLNTMPQKPVSKKDGKKRKKEKPEKSNSQPTY